MSCEFCGSPRLNHFKIFSRNLIVNSFNANLLVLVQNNIRNVASISVLKFLNIPLSFLYSVAFGYQKQCYHYDTFVVAMPGFKSLVLVFVCFLSLSPSTVQLRNYLLVPRLHSTFLNFLLQLITSPPCISAHINFYNALISVVNYTEILEVLLRKVAYLNVL